jgi:hypothetical protein
MEKFERQYVPPEKMPPTLVAKWSADALVEGFVPFPKKLVHCLSKLWPDSGGIKELAVVLAIVDFKRPNPTRFPSMDYLAFLAGLETEEFKTLLDGLVAKGWISVSEQRMGLNISLAGLLAELEKLTQRSS